MLDHGRLARRFLSQSLQHFPLLFLLIFRQRGAFACNITGQEKAHRVSLPFRDVTQLCLILVSEKKQTLGDSAFTVLREKNSRCFVYIQR